jgi:hypothetical protein
MRTIIKVENKEIKNRIRENLEKLILGNGLCETSGMILREISNLRDGQVLGTIIYGDERNRAKYSLAAYETDGSMQRIYRHAKFTLHIRRIQEMGSNYTQEQLDTGKWLLNRGVITIDEARTEYGYLAE